MPQYGRADPAIVATIKGASYVEAADCRRIHCQFGGRPLITAVLQDVLKYISQFPDVWFARHEELGRWALAADVDEHTYQDRYFGDGAVPRSDTRPHVGTRTAAGVQR